jgi:hypothetical protein
MSFVIASEAKQSHVNSTVKIACDCFVGKSTLLAMMSKMRM